MPSGFNIDSLTGFFFFVKTKHKEDGKIVCEHGQLARSCDMCELESRIKELEDALIDIKHDAHQCRVWGGMDWVYAHPAMKRVADKARAALTREMDE